MIKAKQSVVTGCIERAPFEQKLLSRVVLQDKVLRILACLILVLSAIIPGAVVADDADLDAFHALYQSVLDDYVSAGEKNALQANMVDYAGLKDDPRLALLQDKLRAYPKERLDSNSKKIAFYLNAYNILAIAKVTENWPLFKLKSLGSYFRPVWTHPAGEVCKEKVTLRILEHDILRRLGEPRIHFALNCASMSCPDLRKEPYLAEKLERQLSDQTRIFLSQKGKGVKIIDGELWLSSIFKWFEEDFVTVGGVRTFIEAYLPENDRGLEIAGYLNYDWAVNDHLNAGERMRIKRGSVTWFN